MIHFIRHAQSHFNFEASIKLRKQKEEKGQIFTNRIPQFLSLRFDPRFIDCSINETGQEQCLKTRQLMQDIDVDVVLVSPLRRALQTCDIVFKNHKSKPRIIVEPEVREVLVSSCDIGGRLRESMEHFPYFDFSRIKDPDAWYIHSIKNEEVRQQILSKLEEQTEGDRRQRAIKVMMEYIYENQKTNNKYHLSDFPSQKKNLKELSEKYKSIAVVSHYENIICYTGQAPKNAQVLTITTDKIDI